MKYRVRTGYADNAGEARYDSPEAVSCGVPPKERAASAGRRRTCGVSLGGTAFFGSSLTVTDAASAHGRRRQVRRKLCDVVRE